MLMYHWKEERIPSTT